MAAAHVPIESALEQWTLAAQAAAAVLAVLGAYLLLKLRYGWWHPRRPRG